MLFVSPSGPWHVSLMSISEPELNIDGKLAERHNDL